MTSVTKGQYSREQTSNKVETKENALPPNSHPITMNPREEFQEVALKELETWKFNSIGREEDEYFKVWSSQKVLYNASGEHRLVLAYYGPNKDPVVEYIKGNDGWPDDGMISGPRSEKRLALFEAKLIGKSMADFIEYEEKEKAEAEAKTKKKEKGKAKET